MPDKSTQQTFGNATVEPLKSNTRRTCSKAMRKTVENADGRERQIWAHCEYKASIRVATKGRFYYYCRIHARREWLDMAGVA